MNNPYRARPIRARVDHTAAYGVRNQNMWVPMSRPQSDVPPNDTTQQSLVNQSKPASDTWKDPWDWNLDQQLDTQQQQPPPQPPHQQQQHYVPSYQNQGQLIASSAQNHYYKNLNGNTSDVLNQNSVSDRNTFRTEPARQTGSTYTNSFPPFTNYTQNNNGARFAANEWQQMHMAPFNYAPASTIAPTTIENIVHTPNNNEQESEKQAAVASIPSTVSPHDSISYPKSSDVKSPIGDHHNLNVLTDDASNSDPFKTVLIGEKNDRTFAPTAAEELTSNFGQLNIESKSGKHIDPLGESLVVHSSPVEGRTQHLANFNVARIQGNSVLDNMPVLPPDYAPTGIENSHAVDSQPVVGQDLLIPNTYQSAAKITDGVSQSGYDQWYNQNTLENAWYAKDHSRPPPKQWNTPEQNVENYENIQQTSDFINVEVVAPATLKERDIYGSRDSINKETLDNDPKPSANLKEATNIRDFREEVNNLEVLSMQQQQSQQVRPHPPLAEQMPDNYEFASNDRNTFLETGELTDSHQEHEPTPPSQDDENDEVPNDIPFLREVPGQSSTIDPRRNDPTGQEHHAQTGQRLSDPRRNDPSGQEQSTQVRNLPDRAERRDVLPGQERNVPLLLRGDSDTLERRNDPSGRERSLPPQQSRNDPSGEERYQLQSQIMLEPSEIREVLGRGNEPDEVAQQTDAELRQIPGGASSNDVTQLSDDRKTGGRVVTGSPPEAPPPTMAAMQDQASESRSKREEAVGASLESENQGISGSSNRRDSYEDEEDEGSRNSRDESRERRRETSPDRRRYEYDRKNAYYERDREYEDDYYYERRRVGDNDRQYNARDDFERRDVPYRDDERKHQSRDDLDRHGRDDMDRRVRGKEDVDERDGRRRPDDRKRVDDPRRRDPRDYDARYSRDPRDREYVDRDRRRDDRRPRRYDDYDIRDQYRREYYDDPYGRSSRPSSRSSYNDRDREYYMRTRDPYYAYNGYSGYDYGTHYGSNYYAYLENLRRTNPAVYSEWYHKYYASQHQQQHIARGVGNYPEDRASVHSGRSSCDDRTTGDKRTGDMSLLEDSIITSARLTPTKYSSSHAYGCFSIGSLVHVHPSYPADGERAKVDIFRVDHLLAHDPIARDLRLYPGPLINGVTHKKTIIEYCENKIKKAVANEEIIDRASYILLYELMIMLIQQNGNVVGVDIAGLLLRNKDAYPYDSNKFIRSQDVGRRESQISQRSGATGSDGSTQDISVLSEKSETKLRKTVEQITDEFRDTLLYGRVQEALEYAMNEGLWGHALFLASKLDKRTHASVMTRFANSLPPHDPLQTLYQLHSGRVPAIVTCVADPRWDDWRPHLAMIISNTSANPEVNRRSITTLGDTLFARGDIHAAHFCYILAQLDFGAYGTNGVKLVLIGANHNKSYSEFFTMEAVMLTEIYEYARNLSDPCFTLVDLQTFKFDLTVKMVDCGLIEKALLYIEQIATNIANDPSKYKKSFIEAVYVLGDRIKYHDPVYKDAIEDAANVTWLNKLAEIVGKYQEEQTVENETYGSRTMTENQEVHEMKHQQQQSLPPLSSQQQWNTIQADYGDGPTSMMEVNTSEMQSDWQPLSLPTNIQDTYDPNAQYMRNMDESVQYQESQQQDYWSQQPYYQNNYGRNETIPNWQQQSGSGLTTDQADVNNTQQQDKWNYEPVQPTISMTPSTGKQYDPLEELDALETPRSSAKSAADAKKTSEKTAEKKPGNSGGSWFGGLFSKLAPKPKNQMILPDDSDPTIVWDPVAKKWMNKDEDGDSGAGTLAPPPKTSDVSFRAPSMERGPQPPLSNAHNEDAPAMDISKLPTGSNMFKLPKGRSMRANYVDIMNPGGKPKGSAASSNVATPITSPLVPMATSSPQMFVPAPINDPTAPVDFLSPAATPPSGNVAENTPLSRWSSTSSLSREVQSYTMRDPRLLQRNKGPMMFNPNDMKDRSAKNMPPSRYHPR
ncbi:endoplasmic reticulum export factor secretory 16 isoform X2 [Temnothorax americanus]|uniref:endoplasmic reticulum export factor secretory 16 isoform X2 n=1 Tax=Temnothorax americanus TaxID=1964332 RepID=UPI00406877D8